MNDKYDIKRMLKSTLFPMLVLLLMWLSFFLDTYFNLNLYRFGVYARTLNGLIGVFASPFIHNSESVNHIFSNSIPMLFLGTSLFYFYREIALKVFIGIWLSSGIWLWVLSRPSYHIGASGIVYGLAFFLFFSGWIRKSKPLIGLSLLVVFLYGSIIWGIFPIDWSVSFEGHFYGALAGVFLAFFYKKKGPQRQVYVWEEEEEEDFSYVYEYKEKILESDSESK